MKLEKLPISLNRVPFSGTRWQLGSQIYFVSFIKEKLIKVLIAQQQLKLEKNKDILGILRILEKYYDV
jgi:hypothetical protein